MMAKKRSDKSNLCKETTSNDDTSGMYKCKYCEYYTTQDWILLRHLSAVHNEKCRCKTLQKCQCHNKDVLRNPYKPNVCLRPYV